MKGLFIFVEMPGVEPGSGNNSLRTSTYLVFYLVFSRGSPEDTDFLSSILKRFTALSQANKAANLSLTTSQEPPTGGRLRRRAA